MHDDGVGLRERETLRERAETKGTDGMARYRDENNRESIDGLTGE